ncbi:4'-phosphopantetheinyl transferase family protein [Mucilaginibacter myungsuensis]|uniref:4'-phosphopantetheinyl transferase superfamily protein n=1 Tax=Mucilaginibacter myungsuensis TaxID=649104 RepID=A0A929L2L4_9SPHI|nr:4'-phosphopantetheinyl transferase superfamily protein [Mucilaginibacter myungsuensis]MBE9663329.1 4'-phosphopantetheinyl transferase superfamily protein [Mucilaginibacter myungsuensis]MDN3600064.1 4'-phosphopantetheinyl transferase superfamily protein [Mucilaginibacter myungsuensis]
MYSIGNDIVALKAVNAERTITPQFYNKILAGTELPFYQSNCPGIPFYQFVWLAWSVKEAAYKCLKRIQPDLVFSPTRTVITSIDPPTVLIDKIPTGIPQTGIDEPGCYQIILSINSHTLYARSIIYGNELINSIVSPDPILSKVNWGINKTSAIDPDSQSKAVRKLLKERSQAEVIKDDVGTPWLNTADARIPVSLSHHQDWIGYAY